VQFLKAMPKATGAKGVGPIAVPEENRNQAPTLADLGISKKQSATHRIFEDYCRERWGMSARRANQLMTAAEIGTMVPKVTTERQARELARVEPEKREKAVPLGASK